MPELPEVETVRRGLAPVLEGRRFLRVETRRPDLRRPFPPRFVERLTGRKVIRLWRRAKYLLADLDSGESLIIHLGMSGRLTVDGVDPAHFHHDVAPGQGGHGPHDHVEFLVEGGKRIIFTDHRRFGLMDLVPASALNQHSLLKSLGPEPLGDAWQADDLWQAVRNKSAPIKSVLLDQHVVAGLGNIYVCEALHRAGIAPQRAASSIARARLAGLVAAIKAVLAQAVEAGGSSLRDFKNANRELGYFQNVFRVYDRADEACPKSGCKGTVLRIVQAGRSTFYCARCQR